MTPDELIEELRSPWRHAEHVDARRAVFEEAVVLDGLNLRGFDLSGAHFKSGISARGATFHGLTWLMDAKVDGDCDLTDALFRVDLRAERLVADALHLHRIQVRGVLALARVHVRQVFLSQALIMANLTLENAELTDGIDLSGTEIMGGFWAEGAQLGTVTTTDCELHGRRRNWEGVPA